jgi:hypothetical protein
MARDITSLPQTNIHTLTTCLHLNMGRRDEFQHKSGRIRIREAVCRTMNSPPKLKSHIIIPICYTSILWRILYIGVNLHVTPWTIQDVNDKLWTRVPRTKTRQNAHTNTCPGTFNLWVTAERVCLWEVIRMSHHGPPHPYKGARAVADSLTGIHSAICVCVVNRSCIHKGFQVSRVTAICRRS